MSLENATFVEGYSVHDEQRFGRKELIRPLKMLLAEYHQK